jgi:hypothetical protein
MDTIWSTEALAVTVTDIDFLDPALAGVADARERGVRLEVRPVDVQLDGTVYVSPALRLSPAVCRIDLLDSAPGAHDRMHWHPVMDAGEPGERVFDPAIGADPLGWLATRLADVVGLLRRAGVPDPQSYAADAAEVAACRDEIVERVARGLERARRPWPAVTHDALGQAAVPRTA